MKAVIWASIGAAVLLGGCGRYEPASGPVPPAKKPSSRVRVPLSRVYTHAPGGLKLTAPEGWGFLPKAQVSYVEAQCRPQGAEGELPVILMQASKVATDLTMEALVAGYSRQIARGVDNPSIVKDEQLKGGLNGAEAYEIIFTGRLKRQPVEARQVLLRKDGWFYVITQMARRDEFDKRRGAFEEFTRNIEFR